MGDGVAEEAQGTDRADAHERSQLSRAYQVRARHAQLHVSQALGTIARL